MKVKAALVLLKPLTKPMMNSTASSVVPPGDVHVSVVPSTSWVTQMSRADRPPDTSKTSTWRSFWVDGAVMTSAVWPPAML